MSLWNRFMCYHTIFQRSMASSTGSDEDELVEGYKGRGRGAATAFGITLLIAFGLGIYCILSLAVTYWPLIKSYMTSLGLVQWITQNLAIITLFLLLVFGSALIAGVVVVRLSRHHGVGLIKFSIYAIIILPWILIIGLFVFLSYFTGFSISSLLEPVPLVGFLFVAGIMTLVGIVILVRMRDRVDRAGMILKLSGQLLSEEKELILPPIIQVILTLFTFGSAIAVGVYFYFDLILSAADPLVWWILLGVIEFLFLLLGIVITYTMDGIIIAIAHIWYRNRDPRFRDGRTIVWSRLGRIAKFGVLTAIVQAIIAALRGAAGRSRGAGGIIYRAAGGIIGSVWYYINYFTLPSIILEDQPVVESVKRSAKRLFNNFGDVLVREFGANMALGALKLLVTGIFALVGLYFSLLVGLQGFSIMIGIIAFVIISGIATFPLFRAMRVSYLAMLFTYVWDKETGFKKPTRMPTEVKKEIEQWYQSELPGIVAREKEKKTSLRLSE